MEISLRSRMMAGTFAVVGATALAITPIAQPALVSSAQREASSAMVALTGLNSPISDLISTVNMATNYLFSTDAAASGVNPFYNPWIDANFGIALGGLPFLPAALLDPAAGGYATVGIVPQIIADHLPIISQLGNNGSDYINSSLNGLATAGLALSEGVWNFPQAVKDALQAGNIQTALQILTNAIVTPITDAGQVLLDAGNYVLQGVIARGTAVLNTVVTELPQLVNLAVAQGALVVGTVSNIVKSVTTALQASDWTGAYNAVVDGLLAPSGLPGVLLNLTLGAGVQVAPINAPADIPTSFVPSWRTAIQAGVKAIAADLTTADPVSPIDPPPPVAAVKKAAPSTAAVHKVAPSVAAVSTGGNGGSSSSSSGSSSKSSSSNGGSDRGSSKASNH